MAVKARWPEVAANAGFQVIWLGIEWEPQILFRFKIGLIIKIAPVQLNSIQLLIKSILINAFPIKTKAIINHFHIHIHIVHIDNKLNSHHSHYDY